MALLTRCRRQCGLECARFCLSGRSGAVHGRLLPDTVIKGGGGRVASQTLATLRERPCDGRMIHSHVGQLMEHVPLTDDGVDEVGIAWGHGDTHQN